MVILPSLCLPPASVDHKLHRTVVRTENVRVDVRRDNARRQILADHEIVNAPAGVLLARLKAVAPPGIHLLHPRMLVAPGVDKARIQKRRKFFALLVCKPALRRFVFGFFRSISVWATFRSPQAITGFPPSVDRADPARRRPISCGNPAAPARSESSACRS